MKLMTKAIEKKLPKLYAQDGKGDNAMVHVKFFNPAGSQTWYVLEGQKEEDGDWTFFGYVTGMGFDELGYFTLSELESVRLPFGLRIERDLYFTPCTLGEIKRQ